MIRALAPRSHILVASIISFAHTPQYEVFNAQVEAYNAAVPMVRQTRGVFRLVSRFEPNV